MLCCSDVTKSMTPNAFRAQRRKGYNSVMVAGTFHARKLELGAHHREFLFFFLDPVCATTTGLLGVLKLLLDPAGPRTKSHNLINLMQQVREKSLSNIFSVRDLKLPSLFWVSE